jgi:hypothetical protein
VANQGNEATSANAAIEEADHASATQSRVRRWIILVVATAFAGVLFLFVAPALWLVATDNPDHAKWDTGHTQLIEIRKAVEMYYLDNGEYPPALADLSPKYFQQLPKGPFGNEPYPYERTESGCRLTFLGKDQAKDGDEPPDKDVTIELTNKRPREVETGKRGFR